MPGEMTLITVSLSNLSITLPVIYSCMAKRPNCRQQVQWSFAVIFHIETSVLETLNVVYKQFFQASTSPPPLPLHPDAMQYVGDTITRQTYG